MTCTRHVTPCSTQNGYTMIKRAIPKILSS